MATWGPSLPSWSNDPYGYRIALLAAILGGARALYGSLNSLFEGRIGADLAVAIACVAAILVQEPLVAAATTSATQSVDLVEYALQRDAALKDTPSSANQAQTAHPPRMLFGN